jgi:hypothetical protein
MVDMHDEPVVEITWTGERLVRAFGDRRQSRQTMKYHDVGYS